MTSGVSLLASDSVKERLGGNFEQLAERHGVTMFVVTPNDVFPRAQKLLESSDQPSRDTQIAAVTDSYMNFASQFKDINPDVANNIRGGIFADEFRQEMMVDSLYRQEPVGKGFVSDSGEYYGVIVLPQLAASKEKLAGYELNINSEFFQDLPGTKEDWMNWVIEHEATHVGRKHLNMHKDVQVLRNEIEADNGTFDNALAQQAEGNDAPMQIVETVARLRALNAVLTPVDNNHATGPAIGRDDLSAEDVISATQSVRLKIHSAIAVKDDISLADASRLAVDQPERVVEEMRHLEELGAFDGNEITERLVELGLEATDHLKPGYKMDFESGDVDAYIDRKGLDRDLQIYGQSVPDARDIYERIITDAGVDSDAAYFVPGGSASYSDSDGDTFDL